MVHLPETLRQPGRQDDAKVAKPSFADAVSEAGLPLAPSTQGAARELAIPVLPTHNMRQRQKIQFCKASDGIRQGWGRTNAADCQVVTATFMPSATAEELDWFNIFQRQTVNAENAARYLEVFADIDVRAILKDVQAPTLVMLARGDRRIPIAVGGELTAKIPGAEFVTLDSDNHLLLGREPASLAFAAHNRQFLSGPLWVG